MKVDAFTPLILSEVAGCPEPLIAQQVVAAAAELCREAMAWTEFADPIALEEGVSSYAIYGPPQAYAMTVREVWFGAKQLTPIRMDALQQALPNWQVATSSEPQYYNQATEYGTIRVFPIPRDLQPLADGSAPSLLVRTVLVPKFDAAVLPDFLLQRYPEVIAAGAKYRLMRQANKPWTNFPLSALYEAEFKAGIDKAISEEAHERVPGSLRVMSRRFG